MTEAMRESAARMEDFTFTAQNGVRVRVDYSVLRAMTPQERKAQKERAARLYRQLCEKYGLQPCG